MTLTKVSYSMIEGNIVNVLDFGADPTGINDSTSSLQTAINASVGQVVFVPSGTYKLTSVLQIIPGVSLVGEGPEATIFNLTHSGVGIRIGFPVSSPPSGVPDRDQFSQVYEGFRVTANASTTLALQMMRCIYCSFKNIQVLHPTTVGATYVSFRVSGAMYLNTYENCISDTITAAVSANGKGWHIGNGQNEVVQAFAATNVNTFVTCRAVRANVGFDIDNASGCNMINPNAEENATAGIHIRGNYNVISSPWLESASIVCAQYTPANGSGGVGAAQSPGNNSILGGAFPSVLNIDYAVGLNIVGMLITDLTVGANAYNTRVTQSQITGTFTNAGQDGWYEILTGGVNKTIVQYGTSTVYGLDVSINGAVMLLGRTASSPGAAPANQAYLYTRITAGKMQLCANFPTGAVQVIATEP